MAPRSHGMEATNPEGTLQSRPEQGGVPLDIRTGIGISTLALSTHVWPTGSGKAGRTSKLNAQSIRPNVAHSRFDKVIVLEVDPHISQRATVGERTTQPSEARLAP